MKSMVIQARNRRKSFRKGATWNIFS